MASAVVNSGQTGVGAVSTLPISNPAANNILVAFITQTGSISAPSMSAGWAVNATPALGTTSANSLWVATKLASGGETQVAASPASGGTIQGIAYYELSGASQVVDVLVHTDNAVSGESVVSPALTTTNAGDIILGAVGMTNANSGTVSAWTGTGPLEKISASSTRCFAGYYIPGTTLSAVTFTAHWEAKQRPTGPLIVAIKPKASEEYSRGCGDTISVGDSASRAAAKARTASDAVAISDAASRQAVAARTTADTINVGDSAARLAAKAGAAGDAVTMGGSAKVNGAQARTAGDSVIVSDSVSRVVSATHTASDTITASSTAVPLTTRGASAGEPIAVNDSARHGSGFQSRAAGDVLTVDSGLTANVTQLPRRGHIAITNKREARIVITNQRAASIAITSED